MSEAGKAAAGILSAAPHRLGLQHAPEAAHQGHREELLQRPRKSVAAELVFVLPYILLKCTRDQSGIFQHGHGKAAARACKQ